MKYIFSLLWNSLHDFFSSHFLKKVNYFLNFMFIIFLLLFIILLKWYFTLNNLFFSYFVNLYKLNQIYIFLCNLFLMPYVLFLRFIYFELSFIHFYWCIEFLCISSFIYGCYCWWTVDLSPIFGQIVLPCTFCCVSRYTSFSRVNAKESISYVIDILILSFMRSWQYVFLN